MKSAVLLAAFVGWEGVGLAASSLSPGLGFIIGLAVGAGAMLVGRKE